MGLNLVSGAEFMKIAYLINAHKNFEQLERLVSRLDHHEVDFFIHIDKKIDDVGFALLRDSLKKYQLTLISNRVDVTWAGFSQIQATINGLQSIVQSGNNYDYICLISGQDYPITNNEGILDFLARNNGLEFVECYEISADSRAPFLVRFERYSLLEQVNNCFLRLYLERALRVLLPKRKIPKDFKKYGGSSWWAISSDCARYLVNFVETEKAFVDFFRYAICPDETFFQTVIMNSPYSSRVHPDNLHYTNWEPGAVNPRTLRQHDFTGITSSAKLFARKFDTCLDQGILDLLDNFTTDL